MEMEEVYASNAWKKLNKYEEFSVKFNEILKRCREKANEDIKIDVEDERIIVSYKTPISDREFNCQQKVEARYEFYISNDNLIIDEKLGKLRTNYGYDFENNNGGIIETYYSHTSYDYDGVELTYQAYSDSYAINKRTFDEFKDRYFATISRSFNPYLDNYVNSKDLPKPEMIGNNGRYVRRIRSLDNLGIVESVNCQYDRRGTIENIKEEYFFNTFLTRSRVNPERISIINGYPFATVDDKRQITFSKVFTDLGLNKNNYKEVARDRFIRELKDEEKKASDTSKYDMMINKLENKSKYKERTR